MCVLAGEEINVLCMWSSKEKERKERKKNDGVKMAKRRELCLSEKA